jgi:hypothetical protein
MPLFFQTVLLDKASVAGLRLVPPSLATPLGGLITGVFMKHSENLTLLTRIGLFLCLIGSLLTITLRMQEPGWKYSSFIAVGNLGQGIVYPSLLFCTIRASDKKGKRHGTISKLINRLTFADHAVATSLAYLTRSMGTVWGVAAVSTIVQDLVPRKLEAAFHGLPGGKEVATMYQQSKYHPLTLFSGFASA